MVRDVSMRKERSWAEWTKDIMLEFPRATLINSSSAYMPLLQINVQWWKSFSVVLVAATSNNHLYWGITAKWKVILVLVLHFGFYLSGNSEVPLTAVTKKFPEVQKADSQNANPVPTYINRQRVCWHHIRKLSNMTCIAPREDALFFQHSIPKRENIQQKDK